MPKHSRKYPLELNEILERVNYWIGFYDALKIRKGKKPSKWFKIYHVKEALKGTKDKSLLKGWRF